MGDKSFNFCKVVSQELDLEKLRRKFLLALLELQNVERGSIWVKAGKGYTCVEAAGSQSEQIIGLTLPPGRPSIVAWVIENGKMTIAEPGKDSRHFKEAEAAIDIKSRLILCFPLLLRTGEVYGAVEIIETSAGGSRINLDEGFLESLQQLIDIGSIALGNSLTYSAQVKENIKLRQTLENFRSEPIIGKSAAFQSALKMAKEYAATDFPVLITGESGTGKELIAKEIHRLSGRANMPFLIQNCSCIPDTLLESELFGYQKGAFTGAFKSKVGLFEAADGGTVFLDEIGDMPAQLQARILRVVQESEIKPLGETRTKKVDVRIISATNRDLPAEIAAGRFREDLFYRLNVLPLQVPALRNRPEDIPPLLEHFLARESLRPGVERKQISREALEFLVEYSWPGNVRELENFIKHILVITRDRRITCADLGCHFPGAAATLVEARAPENSVKEIGTDIPPAKNRAGDAVPAGGQPGGASFFEGYTWEQLEHDYVLYLLEKNKWHITRAAKEAGVNRSTFDSRMKKLDIVK